ncbi:Proton-conducting membrane transporter [Parafrankia irregularis]|uniref:Proton-conducting membrane transporter n=1 Tax=Parafrankia irregularis TaxID=795642 RepID=A0A0S4QUU9_9ACTN|nr:proton-conducting transporter membrane subunit [Parafrankia irregularis]MBE3202397.1 hypothetical protein [Parafrankia sp. CH37]CUU58911.1 Proton-conducting membrane transporter [Parafrankia irregularis]
MILAVTPLLVAIGLLGGSVAVRRSADPRAARATATWCVAVALGVIAVAMLAERLGAWPGGAGGVVLLAPGSGRWMPFVTCLAGLAATALATVTSDSPWTSHSPRTFARTLLVLACGTAATASDGPGTALASWALSAVVVWRELVDAADPSGAGPARVFGLHHLLGVGACAVGLLLPGPLGPTAAAVLVTFGVGVRQCLVPLHLWHGCLVGPGSPKGSGAAAGPGSAARRSSAAGPGSRARYGSPVGYGAPAGSVPPGLLVAFTAGPSGLLLLPEVARLLHGQAWAGWVVAASGVTALLGAGLGLVAHDVRTALAQVGLALSGVVSCGALAGSVFGTAGHGPAGDPGVALVGAVLAWQVGAVATGGAVMIAAATEARRGPMALIGPGGCFARTPRLAVAFLLFGLTAVGYPATVGFVWEDLVLDGVGTWFVLLAAVLVLAVAGSGATVMKWYFAGYTGRRDHVGEHDLTVREFRAVTVLLVLLLLAQIHPAGLLPVL